MGIGVDHYEGIVEVGAREMERVSVRIPSKVGPFVQDFGFRECHCQECYDTVRHRGGRGQVIVVARPVVSEQALLALVKFLLSMQGMLNIRIG